MRHVLAAALPVALLALPPGALAQDRFLSDGGGIRTERVVGTPYGPSVIEVPALGEGRPFLEDGGGIRFAPDLPRVRGDAVSRSTRGGERHETSSSVLEIPDGAGTRASSGAISVVVLNAPQATSPSFAAAATRPKGYGGAKIIRVSAAQTDRHAFDASGLEVSYSGSTKIIRIAPRPETARDRSGAQSAALALEDGSALHTESPVATRLQPAEAPQIGTLSHNETPDTVPSRDGSAAASVVSASREGDLEPWTEAWRVDCVAKHDSFDPSLGTYRDPAGRRRFCTGEP